ncbi:unnamed protein product [Schistosoma margrebowiei]|uniref:Uncharacterized protein n=1 Tax=Schistosoma margrebowiei TaxID=48269 RepID=A0AA84ZQG7_9TREM|nr:unnamed protein product [Schistosoma margrebowiei]
MTQTIDVCSLILNQNNISCDLFTIPILVSGFPTTVDTSKTDWDVLRLSRYKLCKKTKTTILCIFQILEFILKSIKYQTKCLKISYRTNEFHINKENCDANEY